MLPGSRGHQDQRVKYLGIQPCRVAKRFMAAMHGRGKTRAQPRTERPVMMQVSEPERHVPRLVLSGQPRHGRRHRVGRVPFDEPEQRKEAALSQHGEQE